MIQVDQNVGLVYSVRCVGSLAVKWVAVDVAEGIMRRSVLELFGHPGEAGLSEQLVLHLCLVVWMVRIWVPMLLAIQLKDEVKLLNKEVYTKESIQRLLHFHLPVNAEPLLKNTLNYGLNLNHLLRRLSDECILRVNAATVLV